MDALPSSGLDPAPANGQAVAAPRLGWLELPWLTRKRLAFYPPLFVAMYLVGKAIWTIRALRHGMLEPVGPGAMPLGGDFIEFWAAAKAVLAGMSAVIYDPLKFYGIEQTAVAGIPTKLWFSYPPTLLPFLLPFGFLPYLWAIPLWVAGGIAVYVKLLRRIAVHPIAVWIGLAFPGAILTVMTGQAGFLLTALLGWGLLLLNSNPVLAGLLLGLLSVKPHLFLLLPLALLVSRRWTVFASATLTVLLLVAASWLAFGAETWLAFFDNARFMRRSLEEVVMVWNRVPSVFVSARLLGAGPTLAYLCQGASAVAATATLVWAWNGPAAMPLKASALVVASLLVTPYFCDYDMVLLVLPIAWSGWHAMEHGWLPGEKLMLLAAWLCPGIAIECTAMTGIQLTPVLLFVFLGSICRRIGYERRRAGCEAVA